MQKSKIKSSTVTMKNTLQWLTADAEITDPSVENPELKGSSL